MTGVFIKRENLNADTLTEITSCNDKGKHQDDVSKSQRIPKTVSNHLKLGNKAMKQILLHSLRVNSANTLISDFKLPRLGAINSVV